MSSSDEALMALTIAEARKGRPSPNPHVGAVVVSSDGSVVATGFHARAGEAHAEVDALSKLTDAKGLRLFVTMEPCNHHGRTPPCTDAIIEAGLAEVVVGCSDPAPHVAGATDKLRAAGIKVRVGCREAECRALIADFEKHITTGLPQVTLKAALTLDGRMATASGDSKWITSEQARAEAHRMRDQSDAVLVGVGTVLADDPQLTVRHVEGVDPLRVVLDSRLRTPPNAKLTAPGTLIVHAPEADADRRSALTRHGVELFEVPRARGGLDLDLVLKELGKRNIVRLLVEGGPQVLDAFLASGHADRLAAFVAPRIVADQNAPGLGVRAGAEKTKIAEAWQLSPLEVRMLGTDVLFLGSLRHEERVDLSKRGR